MIIDTHAHVYSDELLPYLDDILIRMKESQVEKVFLPNIDLGSLGNNLRLQKDFPGIFYSMIGLHPMSVGEDLDDQLSGIKGILDQSDCIAIGEIGLDHYWDKTYVMEQEEAFRIQLIWAREKKLPIVIHSRDTIDIIIDILSEPEYRDITGVFHCFTGDIVQAHKIIDLGYALGIGGIVTFKNSHLPEVLRKIPLKNLVLETDSPYLSPVPKRGKTNEPSYLPFVVSKLSQIYEVTETEIEEITSANALDIFGVKEKI